MVLKNVFAAACVLLLGWSAASAAETYRPDQFLGLDLSRAVLSPKPLGPQAEFEPLAVEARGDHDGDDPQVRAEPTAEPRLRSQSPIQSPVMVEQPIEKPRVHAEKPHGAARTRLARRHVSPLDAQAFDTRIQVWPCRSGGICSWKH
jgi:hypothetical protein